MIVFLFSLGSRNASCISDWRDDYTLYQKTKLYEYLKKTYEEIKEGNSIVKSYGDGSNCAFINCLIILVQMEVS